MEPNFWHRRWQKNEIGFHENDGSGLLKHYFDEWSLSAGSRIFVPLCGKTKDIAWLLSKGFSIVAVELNESAVIALFEELGVTPTIAKAEGLLRYSFENVDVYIGDFFLLSAEHLGKIDAIFDRAALVALPEDLRKRYSEHLRLVTNTLKQFLVTYDYDQSMFAGPPFSVTQAKVATLYADFYHIRQLHRDKIKGGFRGEEAVFESVYLLSPR